MWRAFYPTGLAPRATYPDIAAWELLAQSAKRHPEKTALIDKERRLTYAELFRWVEKVAGGLGARTTPGDRVVLHKNNSAEFVAGYYGILRAGCIAVPTSPELDPPQADAGARLVIDGDLPTDPSGPRAPSTQASIRDDDTADIAVLQYTSGTTGAPKGVILTHANLVANAYQNARWFGWSKDEVTLAVLPLFHVWGMSACMNSTFAVGGTLVVADRFDEQETFDLIRRHAASVLYGSATMFHRLLDLPPQAIPTLAHVKAGAMLTQGDLKARWDQRYPHAPLQQGYGLTEAAPECHNNPPHRFKAGTVGIPIQDTDCRISRVRGGEVQLRGPQVSRGYWNRPEETAAAFDDGWLNTGDLGVMDGEGYLTIVDRLKDMLKFRGYSVSPNRVEDCLLAHAAVREAVVVGRTDERDGEVPTAFVVLGGAGAEVSDEALIAHCRERLAHYEAPHKIVRVAAIPKSHVGKPLRRVLRDELG